MSEAYERRVELAHERGFDSPYQQDRWVSYVKDTFGDDYEETFGRAMPYDTIQEIAQFERDYEVGDMSRDELSDWWEEHIGDIDWDDPDDPFFDFLDALSGEGA